MWIIVLVAVLFLVCLAGLVLVLIRPDLFGHKKWPAIMFGVLMFLLLIWMIILLFGFFMKPGTLTVSVDENTPPAGQLVLGEAGVSLAKFKFEAAGEPIKIKDMVISDDMSESPVAGATGTFRNIKLYDGATLLGTLPGLNEDGMATFQSVNLVISKNAAKTLTIKSDLMSYAEGGQPNARHRLFLPDNSVSAQGKYSHKAIVGGNLIMNNVRGNLLSVYRTRISIAKAADAPGGGGNPNTAERVAKFVITNFPNQGNYSARVRLMNFAIDSSGFTLRNDSYLKIYKESIAAANELASTSYCNSLSCPGTYGDSKILKENFTDLEIAAGSSRTIIVTLNTWSAASDPDPETLKVGIEPGMIIWTDDAYGSAEDYTELPSLPVDGNTLNY